MQLQLQVCEVGKLISHNSAVLHPTVCAMGQSTILARAMAGVRVLPREWSASASLVRPMTSAGSLLKAPLPMRTERLTISQKLRKDPRAQNLRPVRRITGKRPVSTVSMMRAASAGLDAARKRNVSILKRPAQRFVGCVSSPTGTKQRPKRKRTVFTLTRVPKSVRAHP